MKKIEFLCRASILSMNIFEIGSINTQIYLAVVLEIIYVVEYWIQNLSIDF